MTIQIRKDYFIEKSENLIEFAVCYTNCVLVNNPQTSGAYYYKVSTSPRNILKSGGKDRNVRPFQGEGFAFSLVKFLGLGVRGFWGVGLFLLRLFFSTTLLLAF